MSRFFFGTLLSCFVFTDSRPIIVRTKRPIDLVQAQTVSDPSPSGAPITLADPGAVLRSVIGTGHCLNKGRLAASRKIAPAVRFAAWIITVT